jgi:AraC family transcriptional regulator of adaptative response/methylated-DNA-[protein]-cysteine methyltransferase
VLYADLIKTKLGTMLAVGDKEALCLLRFVDKDDAGNEIKKLSLTLNAKIVEERTDLSRLLNSELDSYFDGNLINFKTPYSFVGTEFQELV